MQSSILHFWYSCASSQSCPSWLGSNWVFHWPLTLNQWRNQKRDSLQVVFIHDRWTDCTCFFIAITWFPAQPHPWTRQNLQVTLSLQAVRVALLENIEMTITQLSVGCGGALGVGGCGAGPGRSNPLVLNHRTTVTVGSCSFPVRLVRSSSLPWCLLWD